MSDEIKDINAVHEAITEVRGAFDENEKKSDERFTTIEEKVNALGGEKQELVEKCNTVIDAAEEAKQKEFLETKQYENEKKEQLERIDNLESNLVAASSKSVGNYKETGEFKAFNKLLIAYGKSASFGMDMLETETKSFLRTDIGSQGGFRVPEILDAELLRQITEITPILPLVRTRMLRGVKTLDIPIRTGIPTATWVGEAEQVTSSESAFGLEKLTAHALCVKTETTRDLINFAQADMVSELQIDAQEEFAREIGNALLLGDQDSKPQGILDVNSGVERIETDTSQVLSLDDVINLMGEVKLGYNLTYAFHRKVLTFLRTEKDSNGNYLWDFGAKTMPNTLVDIPYVLFQDMTTSTTVAADLPVMIADFFKLYTVLDAMEMEVIRDDITEADKRKVIFNWFRFLDGKVVIPEAAKILKVKA